jgi:D-tyrosyl-tRNA(Tyr) deacylase
MRAVVQRTNFASVTVEDQVISAVGPGLTVLLGVAEGDDDQAARYLAEKTVNLRIFSDEQGKMNLSLLDIKGQLLVVINFSDAQQVAFTKHAEGKVVLSTFLDREAGTKVNLNSLILRPNEGLLITITP